MDSGSAERVLRRIEKASRSQYLPIIGPDRGRILVDLVRKFKPRRILEVGTFVGYSTILMGRELQAGSEIFTIEIDEDEADLARKNIQEAEINPRVEVLVRDAMEIIPRIEGEFDMVFLDADKGEYIDYLRLVEGKLHKGSLVVADNAGSYRHSMRAYLEHVRKSGFYDSRFIQGNWDGVEVSIKL
jgi:predicted O-methyltransferase YrrM